MSRFREYGFWISLTGAIILLLQVIGHQFGFTINENFVNEFVTAFCGILVIMGILIKPKNDGNHDDDNEDNNSNDNIAEE